MFKDGYSVYMHTTPDGKVYIGYSCNPRKRWNSGKGYINNTRFMQAIEKYGWENIKHEIIASGLTGTAADEMEKDLINKYKSNNANYGYNITGGGKYYGSHAESTKRLIGEHNKEWYKHHTNPKKYAVVPAETRDKMSEAAKVRFSNKENHPMYNKPRSESTKRKIFENHADFSREKHPRAKKVVCVETGKTYGCIKDAKEETKAQHIAECCEGKRETSGGFHWRYCNV